MAGRVPAGAKLSEIGVEMETTFVQNLKHAAEILAKVKQHLNTTCLLLPKLIVLRKSKKLALETLAMFELRRRIFFCCSGLECLCTVLCKSLEPHYYFQYRLCYRYLVYEFYIKSHIFALPKKKMHLSNVCMPVKKATYYLSDKWQNGITIDINFYLLNYCLLHVVFFF